ncbi:MAG: flagellar hook-length control protein FliK [Acidobacteriota bacterium]|jgi:flagellar hook-length control protein FliK|nr:flagellar hook-length control protein FliK [Acidobacteriota bacterium]
MNVDFLTSVNKQSGTQFGTTGSSGAPAPGFREQLDRVMRDNDRRNESAVGKKPAGQKKPATAGKAGAPEKNAPADQKYAERKTAETQKPDQAKEAYETAESKFAQAAGGDPDFYGELKEAETSEAENEYALAPQLSEASETSETDYAFVPQPAETPASAEFSDFSVSSSADALLFPPELPGFSDIVEDDSGFAEMVNLKAVVENAASVAGFNAVQQGSLSSAGAPPPAAEAETGLQAVVEKPAAPEPQAANIQQNASFSGSAENGANELLASASSGETSKTAEISQAVQTAQTADDVELSGADSARFGVKDIPENELFQKNLESAQNSGRSDSAASASARDGAARNEIPPDAKTQSEIEQSELAKQSAARASLEDEDVLLERMAAQMTRSRGGAAFANASENAGKTVQVAEASVQAASGAVKPETPVQARSVNASDQEFVIELAGRIQAQIRGGREMIRIQLHPEELGKLDIRAESGRDGIIARIAAESANVKKLLESNLQSLQQSLEARGLKVDRLHIVVEESMDAALYADGGRYGNSGAGTRNPEAVEFSKFAGSINESPQDEETDDLSAAAEQRGVGFYTVA